MIIEIETIERRVLNDPESDLTAVHPRNNEVRCEAKTPANGLTCVTNLVPRVLIAWRVNPSLDVASELRGRERVGEREGAEPVHKGIQHHSA